MRLLMLFICGVLTDITQVLTIRSAAQGLPIRAAIWTGALTLVGLFSVVSVAVDSEDRNLAILIYVLGCMLGTYWTVKWSTRK